MRRGVVGAAMIAAAGFGAGSRPVDAKATWVKKAQAVDPTIKDCLACHVTKKGREPNAGRGQFLLDRKQELGAKDVDLEWLRDYKEPEPGTTPVPTETPSAAPPAPEPAK